MSDTKRNVRLEKLVEVFRERNSLSYEEIAEELGISCTTASRDIKALRQRGYSLACENGRYQIVKEPSRDSVDNSFSMIQFRLIHLIKTIAKANEHRTHEDQLIKEYVKEGKSEEDSRLKVTRKTLMKNLQLLTEAGIILKEYDSEKGTYYKLVEPNINCGISVDASVKLIQFIRANLGLLPYDKTFISIADKLENAVLRSLTRYDCFSREEVFRELGTAYKLFSEGSNNDINGSQEAILSELERLCSENRFAEIWLKGKDKPVRHFCILIIYQLSLGRWYLVVKTKGKERNFGTIRVDNIERVKEVCEVKADEAAQKRLDIAKEQAYEELVNSFGMGLGGKTKIKLRVNPHKDIVDSVLLRLESSLCGDFEEGEDGGITLTVKIDGVSDFLHWARGYGSGIMILEPEFVRRLQYEEMIKLLEAYGEV